MRESKYQQALASLERQKSFTFKIKLQKVPTGAGVYNVIDRHKSKMWFFSNIIALTFNAQKQKSYWISEKDLVLEHK